MPHPDGRAVLLTLNASPAWRARFAVILCSARNELAEVARELGADDYLEKPFKIARLLELVQRGYWQLLADSAEAREHRNANSAD
jgi:CheY-like chemotaxis protein